MAKVTSLEFKKYGTPQKTYAVVHLDEKKHVAFGKTLDGLEGVAVGDQVSFGAEPGKKATDDPVLTWIKKDRTSDADPTKTTTTAAAQQGTATAQKAKQWDDQEEKLASVMMSYAKDIVTSKILTNEPMTMLGTVDQINTIARELIDVYYKLVRFVKEDRPLMQKLAGAANPTSPAPQKPALNLTPGTTTK